MNGQLPKFLQSSLWSYNISKLDKLAHARLIISQILNFGTSKQVEWVLQNYSSQEIQDVLSHPRRGMWHREKLRYWLHHFDTQVDPLEFETAIIELSKPRLKLYDEFWKRKELDVSKFTPRNFNG